MECADWARAHQRCALAAPMHGASTPSQSIWLPGINKSIHSWLKTGGRRTEHRSVEAGKFWERVVEREDFGRADKGEVTR